MFTGIPRPAVGVVSLQLLNQWVWNRLSTQHPTHLTPGFIPRPSGDRIPISSPILRMNWGLQVSALMPNRFPPRSCYPGLLLGNRMAPQTSTEPPLKRAEGQ